MLYEKVESAMEAVMALPWKSPEDLTRLLQIVQELGALAAHVARLEHTPLEHSLMTALMDTTTTTQGA